jgi:hypothetical protein
MRSDDLRGSPSGAGELNHGNELWMVDVRAAGVDRQLGYGLVA